MIKQSKTALGIEFGSTRIKAVLIDENHDTVATGSHTWENRLDGGFWTYSEKDIVEGLQAAFRNLKNDFLTKFSEVLETTGAIGISAMMHGYLAFNSDMKLLVPFRTWRNTTTEKAANELSEAFEFAIPQRWSVAHFYQAILNQEPHIESVSYFTTLAGYVHFMLTGKKVLGIGDASGMFPISSEKQYDKVMTAKFDFLLRQNHVSMRIAEILPQILCAGESAGKLTDRGARLLDPSGDFKPGIPFCPPEGDAGTGMVGTNSVKPGTANISAGTSAFLMTVLSKRLSKPYPNIDVVATPDGKEVAMIHANNCTNEINAWAALFSDFLEAYGIAPDMSKIYETIFNSAVQGENNAGNMVLYNCLSGEPLAGVATGHPLFLRNADSKFTFENFARLQLYAAIAPIRLGLAALKEEGVTVSRILGHGGFFHTPEIGRKIVSAATGFSVATLNTADNGGAWGMAVLAAYLSEKETGTLADYLEKRVFVGKKSETTVPSKKEIAGFDAFFREYSRFLPVEQLSSEIN